QPMEREEVLDAIVSATDSPPVAGGDSPDEASAYSWDGPLKVQALGRPVRPKTPNQERYLEAIRRNDLVFGLGPAGTGKTYLAVAAAVHLLRAGRMKKLVLARPAVEAG